MVQAKWLSLGIYAVSLSSTSVLADVSARIINGKEATQGNWPFMAALVSRNVNAYDGQFCGASFIGERYVLTAAHCVEGNGREDLDVVIGVSNLSASQAAQHRYAVDNIYVHEYYNSAATGNDIAIIELAEKPAESVVNLVDGYTRGNLNAGQMLTVMGWGDQDASDGYSSKSELYQVNVPLVNQYQCNTVPYSGYSSIGSDAFCAGYSDGGYDSCQGDSGGPIVVSTNGIYEQLGIVSWGKGCAEANAYGVYTNISYFDDWIDEQKAGFSYRQVEMLGARLLAPISHTFEFTNKSDQNIQVNRVYPISGNDTVITDNGCSTLTVGQSCEVVVSYNLNSIGEHEFGINVDTDLLVGTVTSTVSVIGARSVTNTVNSYVSVPNSGIYNTQAWITEGDSLSSPPISHGTSAALIVEGIPAGTVSFDLTASSEADYDFVEVYSNGQKFDSVSGEFSGSVNLPLVRDADNSFMITYVKDSSGSSGSDRVTITNFAYTDEIKISKSEGTQNAKSSGGGSGGSLAWHWLLVLFGGLIVRKLPSALKLKK
ncbi:Secreted trypsin-like serine protease [Vibrio crassostreae]|uniref:Secreted trypsin-like serine protease n=2 Tax=Vibrio crassostreae TaxID=246167 RepID=A0A822MT28_9VIBR|nr:trypsin-like serine protease [Vibrio crassostreae]MDH5952734.1 trypsin-like serine protease [Vibrio crassostreae]TCN04567.1 secreted trypsin-like serine protease [Vibrio crassostreae]TCU04456.1 secreted trypsin-like serine protease [Vibrio crassostreae]CAK1719242.1 Secreted trypsin-like serine protease [Vibrio crassostreae]CAK1780900.1 Secreted trypsin-like serine protease [Vibrio crassostreae]